MRHPTHENDKTFDGRAGRQDLPPTDQLLEKVDALEQVVRQEVDAHQHEECLEKTWDKAAQTPAQTSEIPDQSDGHSQPAKFGNYELLEKIGEGGMGSVWKAKQFQPVVREVAIKMVNASVASAENLKRFQNERQTLARMNHPNISTILDGGTTPDGQPYLVMELAGGVRLDEYCQQNRLTINERIRLVAEIAQALTHAHEQNIVHRDLKPGNILVETHETGIHFKIIDFGISKLTDPGSANELTIADGIVGTPHYMSPEQAGVLEGDVDPRSDVYSLGAILYQLITDAPPLAAAGVKIDAGLPSLFAALKETDPPRPSYFLMRQPNLRRLADDRATNVRYLTRQIRRDLDWITLKALAKDPNERYQTAAVFADDLIRFLNIQPVTAQRPTWSYRIRKLLQRRRAICVLAATLLLTIAISVTGFLLKSSSDNRAKHRKTQQVKNEIQALLQGAQRDLSEAYESPEIFRQKVNQAYSGSQTAKVLANSGDSFDDEHTAIERLETKLTFLQSVDKTVQRFAAAKMETLRFDPVQRTYSRMRGQKAIVQAFADFGIDFNKHSPDQAVRFCSPVPDFYKIQFAEAIHFWFSELQTAGGESTRRGRWCVAFLKQLDPDPWRSSMRRAVVEKNTAKLKEIIFADANEMRQQPPFALLMFADALATNGETQVAIEQLAYAQSRYPENVWLTQYLGKALMYDVEQVDYSRAARYLTAAVSLDPQNSMMHQALGEALLHLEKYSAAIQSLRIAIRISPDFIQAKQQLANALQYAGQFDEAIKIYREILQTNPEEPSTIGALGAAYFRAGKTESSIKLLRQAIQLAPDDPENHVNLSHALTLLKKSDESMVVLETVLRRFPKNIAIKRAYGTELLRAGRARKAIKYLKQVAAMAADQSESHYDLALAYHHAQKFQLAKQHYQRAIDLNPNCWQARQALRDIERWLKESGK